MDRGRSYNLSEDFISQLTDFIEENFLDRCGDYRNVACVFGGKRPSLFLTRSLAKRLKRAYYPPRTFSIDEFLTYLMLKKHKFSRIGSLEACHTIYTLTKKVSPSITTAAGSFSQFLPWAEEIVAFIEQLDLEDVDNESLRTVQMSAAIGYEVPQSVNNLLKHIIKIRTAYHAALKKKSMVSRGLLYCQVSKEIKKIALNEFDAVIFCNFFYLHETEARIIDELIQRKQGIYLAQGDPSQWSVLAANAKRLNMSLVPTASGTKQDTSFSLYAGGNLHAQVCLVREIIKKLKNKEDTVIVLPRREALIPLLSEISSYVDDYNVSLGYPLSRSALFALINALFAVQESKKDSLYYSRDYLKVLRHPLVKNALLRGEAVITRVIVHKIEEALAGTLRSEIGGSLFISLDAIEEESVIYEAACATLKNIGIATNPDDLIDTIKHVHRLFFRLWEGVDTFRAFARTLNELIDALLDKSMVAAHPVNLKVVERLKNLVDEFESLGFSDETCSLKELSVIFLRILRGEVISFSGSPLKGLQILGLFETRSLSFENVIIMDVNESALPKLKIYEPLIPREVMLSLGLNRLEKEEEIQRYQFMRLIRGAKHAHLIYEENQVKEKSRFIENLLWQKQKEAKRLHVIDTTKGTFYPYTASKEVVPPSLVKTKEIIESLKSATYSASRVNTYLNCPLEFYYRYVLGLGGAEDLLAEPQAREVGTFVHELLEEAFKMFLGKQPVFDRAFRERFWGLFETRFAQTLTKRMKADAFLLKHIIKNRLEKFIAKEEERGIGKIISLEREFKETLALNGHAVKFISKVDRIDEASDGEIMIIDYKTGGADLVPRSLQALEAMELNLSSIREKIKSFQLPLYYVFVAKQFSGRSVNAQTYSIRNLEQKSLFSTETPTQRSRTIEKCMEGLTCLISEIFDPQVPFTPTKGQRRCQFCVYAGHCR